MNYLAMVFPALQRHRIPFSRDQAMLAMAAFNLIMLGVDSFLAHGLNLTILPREWIPIIFGFVGGTTLFIAGVIAIRKRNLASWLATLVFVLSMVVGVLGAYFHFVRGTLPSAPPGEQVSVYLLIWAPPIFAPLAFAGIGFLGIVAAWAETPPTSGIVSFPFGTYQMPFSKTRAYLFLVSLGILAALLSSVLDHARTGWESPWLWLPVVMATMATAVSFLLAAMPRRLGPTDVLVYLTVMVLLILVGLIGVLFHIQADLTSELVIVPERFLRGAPFLAPLLFSNMGIIGICALLSPTEGTEEEDGLVAQPA